MLIEKKIKKRDLPKEKVDKKFREIAENETIKICNFRKKLPKLCHEKTSRDLGSGFVVAR